MRAALFGAVREQSRPRLRQRGLCGCAICSRQARSTPQRRGQIAQTEVRQCLYRSRIARDFGIRQQRLHAFQCHHPFVQPRVRQRRHDAVRMLPVAKPRTVHVDPAAHLCQQLAGTGDVLEVAVDRECHLLPELAPRDLRPYVQFPGRKRGRHQPRAAVRRRVRWRVAGAAGARQAALAQVPEIAQHQVRVVPIKHVAQAGDRAGQQHVVGVDEPQVARRRFGQQPVACRGNAAVARRPQHPQLAGMHRRQPREDGAGVVAGRIVQHQHFDAGIARRLLQQRVQAGFDVTRGVVRRHQQAQPGRCS